MAHGASSNTRSDSTLQDIHGSSLATVAGQCGQGNHEFNGQEIEVERLIPTGDEIIGLTFQKSKEVPSLYNLAFILWSIVLEAVDRTGDDCALLQYQ